MLVCIAKHTELVANDQRMWDMESEENEEDEAKEAEQLAQAQAIRVQQEENGVADHAPNGANGAAAGDGKDAKQAEPDGKDAKQEAQPAAAAERKLNQVCSIVGSSLLTDLTNSRSNSTCTRSSKAFGRPRSSRRRNRKASLGD